MAFNHSPGINNLAPYEIHSRREIITLLHAMQEQNQLVSLRVEDGMDTIVTSILEVDESSGLVVIDRAPGNTLNQRILTSGNVAFEALLDNIRILFFASQVKECLCDNASALCIAIPASLFRLQRREHYRVPTPVVNPLRCIVPIPPGESALLSTATVTVHNISGGGIAIMDEKKQLEPTMGKIYKDCRLELPGGVRIVMTLQIRNSQEVKLPNGKLTRRVGCMFVDLPAPMLASIQRYITKLERERNAKVAGLG